MGYVYSPTDVSISVDGFEVTGYAEDSMVEISRNSEARTLHVGAQGEVVVTLTADRSGQIKINLKQNSPANQKLTELYNQLESFSCIVKDSSLPNSSASGSECYVQKLPDWKRGKEVGEVEWVLLVADLDMTCDGLL